MIEAETSLKGSPAATNDCYQTVALSGLATEGAIQLRLDPSHTLSNIWRFVITIMLVFTDTKIDTSACQVTGPELLKSSKDRRSVNDVGAKVRKCRPSLGRHIAQAERLQLHLCPDLSTWNQQNLRLGGSSLISPPQLQHQTWHYHDYILPARFEIVYALRKRRSFVKRIKCSSRHELSRHIRKVLDRDHGRISRQLEDIERKAYRRLLFTIYQLIGKSNTTRRLIDQFGASRIGAFAFRRHPE